MARLRRVLPSLDLIDDPAEFIEAVRAFRMRVPMTDAEYAELEESEREFAFRVASVTQADVVTQVWDALDSAIASGTGFDDFKEQISDALAEAWGAEDGPRLDTIFRTNVQSAYNAGHYAQATDPVIVEARPYWRFVAIEDERTTDICGDADGTVQPADGDWWANHVPPLHFNCRSTFVALTEEEAREEGLDENAPRATPDEGFGSVAKADRWEPDVDAFPGPIGEVLEERLK